jgi:hypothetical protein
MGTLDANLRKRHIGGAPQGNPLGVGDATTGTITQSSRTPAPANNRWRHFGKRLTNPRRQPVGIGEERMTETKSNPWDDQQRPATLLGSPTLKGGKGQCTTCVGDITGPRLWPRITAVTVSFISDYSYCGGGAENSRPGTHHPWTRYIKPPAARSATARPLC